MTLGGPVGETSATIIYGNTYANFDFYHIKLNTNGKFPQNVSVTIQFIFWLKIERLTP